MSSRRGDDTADPSDDEEFNAMDEDSDSDDDDGILQVFTPPKPKPASKDKLSAKMARKPTAKKAQQLLKKGRRSFWVLQNLCFEQQILPNGGKATSIHAHCGLDRR